MSLDLDAWYSNGGEQKGREREGRENG